MCLHECYEVGMYQTYGNLDNMGGSIHIPFITAEEVAELMGVSRSKAYQIVRGMNRELKERGYITVAGRCPRRYFQERVYGMVEGGEGTFGRDGDMPAREGERTK